MISPSLHHRHVVGQPRDDGQVVADQDQGLPAALGRLELVEHLGLHGHVERGGRLVGDHQPGVERDRRGDQRALAQPAGQLVGALAGAHLGLGDADELQQLDRAPAPRAGVAPAVQAQRLLHLLADRTQRVERDERVLRGRSRSRARGSSASRRSSRPSRLRPSNSRRSALTCDRPPVSPTSVRAVTLLPEPDSPTSPRHSPAASENETPRTTGVSPNATWRFSTRSSGVVGSISVTSLIGRVLLRALFGYGGRWR